MLDINIVSNLGKYEVTYSGNLINLLKENGIKKL